MSKFIDNIIFKYLNREESEINSYDEYVTDCIMNSSNYLSPNDFGLLILKKLQEDGYEVQIYFKNNNFVETKLIKLEIEDNKFAKVNVIPQIFIQQNLVDCLCEAVYYIMKENE